MSLFRRKKSLTQKIALVLDVGSASVGGALVLLRGSRPSKILYTTRRPMVFNEELNFERFTASMLSALKNVTKDIETKGLRHLTFTKRGDKAIDRVLCSYASPWYVSQVKVLTVEKDKPFIVTQEVIDGIVQRAEKEIAHASDGGEIEKVAGDALAIERQIIDITLGGYQVNDPYGKKTKAVSATVAMTIISESVRSTIEEIITRSFHTENFSHHSFPLVGFTVIRDLDDSPENFLFVDVSGEVTDVSLVKNNSLLDNVSFPKGKHFVIRELARSMGVSIEEAVSSLRMYLNQESADGPSLSFEAKLPEIRKSWLKSFGSALEGISSEVVVPHKVYLTADREVAKLFADFIKGDKAHEDMLTAKPFDITDFRGTQLSSLLEYRGGARPDPFLALETIYFNKILALL